MPAILAFCRRLWDAAAAADRRLLAAPSWVRRLGFTLTAVVMIGVSLPNVPKAWLDLGRWPGLGGIEQRPGFGPDTIGDGFTARAVLHDPSDMYTKARTEQTPLEAATWSKEASAPYPPAALLAEAGAYALGERLGVGFYGVILALACVFLVASARRFWQTRWYLFPLLYLNFSYFSERFVYVQDNTYLIMLAVVMMALYAARRAPDAAHVLMALAIAIKLSPLYYAKNLPAMRRATAAAFLGVLLLGLVAPYFVWENYLYIYRYGSELKGDWNDAIGALVVAATFGLVIAYVDVRAGFDLEDRIGWGLVPFAMFLGLKMNVARHLLVLLLVPDKRALRNVAAAAGLAVPALLPSIARFNAALPVALVVLAFGLLGYLDRIGWATVQDDLRHPGRTLRLMMGRSGGAAPAGPLVAAGQRP
ncbi:MAG: hypothetical protein IT184_13685 [Acidobacteria bacterium]|nr:hypothetical protein [Acidobacteriota bacterium]